MLFPEMPTEPWQKVGTDLFHVNGKDFLLVIDYHSNYPEVAQLNSASASAVITRMKRIFGRHGIPQIVQSDNGRSTAAKSFKCLQRSTGSNTLHQALSIQRQMVRQRKEWKSLRLLKKAAETKSDPYLALFMRIDLE